MILEIFAFLLGLGLGFFIARDRYLDTVTPAGRMCVYETAKGELKLGKLAQRHCDADDLLIIDAVTSKDRFLPFVIGRGNVRFYTNNGDAINENNWKELE